MKPALVLKKYKKQFLELKYLYAELDYFEDTLKEAHEEFKKLGFNSIKDMCKKNHIIYDLKHVFSAKNVDLRL